MKCNVTSTYMNMPITVHNCSMQYCTKQFR